MKFGYYHEVTLKYLMDNVSELDIFLLWCKDFKVLGKNFRSPIVVQGANNESTKSGNLAYIKDHFTFRDFRLGQSFNAMQFASIMTGISDYRNLVRYLCEKFNLNVCPTVDIDISDRVIARVDPATHIEKLPINIDVRYEPWRKESLEFWIKHGWSPDMLDKAQIRPIERFWMSAGDEYRQEYNRPSIGPISFVYDFGIVDGIYRRKVYNPLTSSDLKWKNNSNKKIIQGLNTIDWHVKTLYLTSSLKDCGPFWILSGQPCAVAPNSESSLFSVNQVRMLRQISDRQIIWYDNDLVGINNAKKQANLYGFEYKYNSLGSPKDPSDYVKQRGLREFNKLKANGNNEDI